MKITIAGWLAAGTVGNPLRAGKDGESPEAPASAPAAGAEPAQPGASGGAGETKAEGRSPAAAPAGGSGLYQMEGARQEDPDARILGMRADQDPSSEALRGLEGSEAVADAAAYAHQAAYRGGFGRYVSMEDAAPGFGSNVSYHSRLLKQIAEDLQAGEYGGRAPLFLDAGSGFGYNSEYLIRLGARVVAVDQSTEQLAILRRRLLPELRGSLYLNDGDLLGKTFPDGTFDGILASHLLHYLRPAELQDLAARFHRWLRPGGRLYIQAFTIDFGMFQVFRPIYDLNKAAGIPWPGSIADARALATEILTSQDRPKQLEAFLEGFGDHVHAIELDDLVRLLEASGFTLEDAWIDGWQEKGDRRAGEPGGKFIVNVVAQAHKPDGESKAGGAGDGKAHSGAGTR